MKVEKSLKLIVFLLSIYGILCISLVQTMEEEGKNVKFDKTVKRDALRKFFKNESLSYSDAASKVRMLSSDDEKNYHFSPQMIPLDMKDHITVYDDFKNALGLKVSKIVKTGGRINEIDLSYTGKERLTKSDLTRRGVKGCLAMSYLGHLRDRFQGTFFRSWVKHKSLRRDIFTVNCDDFKFLSGPRKTILVNGKEQEIVDSVIAVDPSAGGKKPDETGYAVVYRLADGRFLIREVGALTENRVSSHRDNLIKLFEMVVMHRVEAIFVEPVPMNKHFSDALLSFWSSLSPKVKNKIHLSTGYHGFKAGRSPREQDKHRRIIRMLASLSYPHKRLVIDKNILITARYTEADDFFYQLENMVFDDNNLKNDRIDAVYLALHFLNIDMPLEKILLKGQPVIGGQLSFFSPWARWLKVLDISKCGIVNADLEAIAELFMLEQLLLSFNKDITAVGLVCLKKMARLKRLVAINTDLKDDDLLAIAKLTSLKLLWLCGNSDITLDGLREWVLEGSKCRLELKVLVLRGIFKDDEKSSAVEVLPSVLDGKVYFSKKDVRPVVGIGLGRDSDEEPSPLPHIDSDDEGADRGTSGIDDSRMEALEYLLRESGAEQQADEGSVGAHAESVSELVPRASDILDRLTGLVAGNPELGRFLTFIAGLYLERQRLSI